MEGIALHSVCHGPVDLAALEDWREKVSLWNTLAGGLVEALATITHEDICGLKGSCAVEEAGEVAGALGKPREKASLDGDCT